MMEHTDRTVVLTTFTDPMMGLSYECEPIFRKLETHFREQITFRYVMSLLVRDVYDLVDPADLAKGKGIALQNYNARLAKIYEEEESISGMPVWMNQFCLFSEEDTSSLPLNLAYKAAQLTAPELADRFLYNLRYATIVDCRPTTRLEEILRVVEKTGIDTALFLERYRGADARRALARDLEMGRKFGLHALPAYLLEYQGRGVLTRGLIGYDVFVSVIAQLTGGTVKPRAAAASIEAVRALLSAHPLISPIELREALNCRDIEEVRKLVQPLLDSGEITLEPVHHGWFIRRRTT